MHEYSSLDSMSDDAPKINIYTFPIGTTVDEALAELDAEGVPVAGYRCQHSYDCCAGWYPSKAQATIKDGRVVVRQSWYQNI